MTNDIREWDIYNFCYNSETLDKYNKAYPGADTHCFEGILIARYHGDVLMLFDTYWEIGGMTGKVFTIEQAHAKGTLEYVGNLHELEPGFKSDYRYYKSEDLVTLHTQHACVESCIYHYRRQNAQRDAFVILDSIGKALDNIVRKQQSMKLDIEQLSKQIQEVQNGNLDINIWC
jgi:hypothetical protein